MSRVAIAHDYLTQRGGAERVVLAMLKAFPEARIYTTLYEPESTYPEFRDADIVCSPLNRIDILRRHHRAALPLLPLAARTLTIEEEVVITSSSGWAHGFNARGKRLVYCHAPARWLYQADTYLGTAPGSRLKRLTLAGITPLLTRWDQGQARKATRYLANSRVVRDRILDIYGIQSEVLPAPHTINPEAPQVEVPALADWSGPGFHLVVSRLLPYKNVDQAIDAIAALPEERLVIVGSGPEQRRLRLLAPPNVRMVDALTDAQMRWVYAHATALIAPSIEDYGLTPLEAGAFGKPTLALHAGGYLDTVEEHLNGLFFDEPTPEAIRAAITSNRTLSWDRQEIRHHVERFGEAPFIARLREIVAEMQQS